MLKLRNTPKVILLGALAMGMAQSVSASGPGWGPQMTAGPGVRPGVYPMMAPRQARIAAPRPWTKRYVPPRVVQNFYRKQPPVAYRPMPAPRAKTAPAYRRMTPPPMAMAIPGPYRPMMNMPRPPMIAKAPRFTPRPPMIAKAPRFTPRPPMIAKAPRFTPRPPMIAGAPRFMPPPTMIAGAPRFMPPPAVAWSRPMWQRSPGMQGYPPMIARQMPKWRGSGPAPWQQARFPAGRPVQPQRTHIAARQSVKPPPGPYVSLPGRNSPAFAAAPAKDPRNRDHQAAFGAMVPVNPVMPRGTSG